MKKFFLFVMVLGAMNMVSCKNGSNQENEDVSEVAEVDPDEDRKLINGDYAHFVGEYYYSEEGAVIKGEQYIYAVKLNDLAKELAEMVEPVKKEEFDMVPVVVKGFTDRNPALDEGKEVWERILTIKEIVSVGDATAEADIRIEEPKS